MADTGDKGESSDIRTSYNQAPCTKKGIGSKGIMPIASLDDLEDFLLVEVLQRLPTAKSAISCKSVCKRWRSLISSEYFIRCFITHHTRKNLAAANVEDCGRSFDSLLGTYRNPTVIILNIRYRDYHETQLDIFNETLFDSCTIDLTFLREEKESIGVLASSFSDLLLCGANRGSKVLRYYVCNPFTCQYLTLPPFTKQGSYYSYLYGLVSEPFYLQDSHGGGECTVHSECRFRVVKAGLVFHRICTLEIYSSEKNEWTEITNSVLSGCPRASNAVPYNGRLHWFDGENVCACDPFDSEKSCILDGSEFRTRHGDCSRYFLGVCQGRLRIMQLKFWYEHTLTVWELKNYATWDWSLEHTVDLEAMLSKIIVPFAPFFDREISRTALAFHPTDGAVVYLSFKTFIFSCNLRTRKSELFAKNSEGNMPYDCKNFFPVELPLWPTPLPILP